MSQSPGASGTAELTGPECSPTRALWVPRGAARLPAKSPLRWLEQKASAAPGQPRARRPHPAACPASPVPGEPDDGARPLWGNSATLLDPDRGGGATACGSVILGRPWRLLGPSKTRGSWKSAQETLDVETPGSLPDSYSSELDSTSLSPSRKLALGQEWRRPGDPPSYGP